MTESGLRQGHGIAIPYEYSLRDVYHLLSIFGASGWFDALPSRAQELRSDLQECEIRRLILSVAIMVRNGMDAHGAFRIQDLAGLDTLNENDSVGQVQYDSDEKSSPLTLRDASNKILHAEDMTFDYQTEMKVIPPGTAVNPIIYVYGRHGSRQWKATIEIVTFCEMAIYAL